MKTSVLIQYWGPPGSGRSSSIRSLVESREVVFGDMDYRLRPDIARHHGWPEVRLGFSSIASKFFYRPDESSRPRGFEAVLAHLTNASGFIFVADSQAELKDHNVVALRRLRADLKLAGREPSDVRLVYQLNKRDLPNALPVDVLLKALRDEGGWHEYVETVASTGTGTMAAVEQIMLRLGNEGLR